ncbi:STAS domain-containing protein [candidate division KSB1 bacterium]|nr:STAS domain-containing protein [candidate division KSB1 bacterium]
MIKIETREINRYIIVDIKGDVDLYSSPQIRKVLLENIAKKVSGLIINLKSVSYMDSSGIATLVESLQRLNEYRGKLVITHVQGAVKDVFELSRLDKVFTIVDNESDALKVCNVEVN